MSKNTQYAWKVVAVSQMTGLLMSAIWPNFVKYSTRKWSLPHKGDNQFLFVFGSRRQARQYIKTILLDRTESGQMFRVFRCKVRNLTEDRLVKSGGKGRYRMKTFNMPTGTMFADAVKLVE